MVTYPLKHSSLVVDFVVTAGRQFALGAPLVVVHDGFISKLAVCAYRAQSSGPEKGCAGVAVYDS